MSEQKIKNFYTIEQLHEILGKDNVHIQTIHNWVKVGIIPSISIGQRKLIPAKYVYDNFLQYTTPEGIEKLINNGKEK